MTLAGQRIVVTGGTRGLGRGIVDALVARGAHVTVVARTPAQLPTGATQIAGDIVDEALATRVLRDVRPEVLILDAGAYPDLAPLHEQTWEGFSRCWNTDVRGGLAWISAALRQPLARGSRVLVVSSGAAIQGSPLSGGYAGAKRMLWLMADYANGVSKELDRGIRFQVIVPMQIIADTDLGRAAAERYSRKAGLSLEQFMQRFGAPLTPSRFGEHVANLLDDPTYSDHTALGIKGDIGIKPL